MSNVTLSPDGIGLSGWPLAFSASYWSDMGMKSYQVQNFSFLFLMTDILIFYFAMHSILYIITRLSRPYVQRYNLGGYIRRFVPYTPLIVFCLLGLLMTYYVVQLSVEGTVSVSSEVTAPAPLSPTSWHY